MYVKTDVSVYECMCVHSISICVDVCMSVCEYEWIFGHNELILCTRIFVYIYTDVLKLYPYKFVGYWTVSTDERSGMD